MSQITEVRGVATRIIPGTSRDGKPSTQVWYHTTCVVEWTNETIWLCTGGWFTATTKLRMNQAAHQFDLGFSVSQKDFSWHVTTKAGTFEFYGRDPFAIDRVTGKQIGHCVPKW